MNTHKTQWYRLLKLGEKITRHDEWLDLEGVWHTIISTSPGSRIKATDLGYFRRAIEQPDPLEAAHRIAELEAALQDITEGYIHETAAGWNVPRAQ